MIVADKELPTWEKQASDIFKKKFLNNVLGSSQDQAKKYLTDTLKGQITGAFKTIKGLTVEQQFAYSMRTIAHAWSYSYPQIGQTYPGLGQVIYFHRSGGANLFVTLNKTDKGYNVHFCNAGTHELCGVARDLNPVSNSSSWYSRINEDEKLNICAALFQKLQYFEQTKKLSALQQIPLYFAFHGHSLGGHDAQICALSIMNEIDQGHLRGYAVKEVLVNTQNALKISAQESANFKLSARTLLDTGIAIRIHHGVVKGDVVQTAGHYLLGHDSADLKQYPNFKMEVFVHESEQASGLLAPHTVKAPFTTPRLLSDEESASWLVGYTLPNTALAILGAPLHALTGACAFLGGTNHGSAADITPSMEASTLSNGFYDLVSGAKIDIDMNDSASSENDAESTLSDEDGASIHSFHSDSTVVEE